MTRAALLIVLVLTAAGCKSPSCELPPGWARLAVCGPGGPRVDTRDQVRLRQELRLARRIERPGQAINALKALEAKLPDAAISPMFRLRSVREIEAELNRRLRDPIPLEPVLIELALAHPAPPAARAVKAVRAKVAWPTAPEGPSRRVNDRQRQVNW